MTDRGCLSMDSLLEGLRQGHTAEDSFNGLFEVLRRLNQLHLEKMQADVGLQYAYPVQVYEQILEAVLDAAAPGEVDLLLEQAMQGYGDLRFYGYRIFARMLQQDDSEEPSHPLQVARIFKILSHTIPTQASSSSSTVKRQRKSQRSHFQKMFLEMPKGYQAHLASPKAQAQEFSQAWMALIGRILGGLKGEGPTVMSYKRLMERLLRVLHRRVLPFMTRPVLLADFLTAAYEVGGLTGILALEGLFHLIQRHNLDYPSFFAKLYALLCQLSDQGLLLHFTEHRTRFLSMLGRFMQSTMLPAHIVAAFVKRTLRMALSGTPGMAMWALAFAYNQMKAHPVIRVMIHREDSCSSDDEFDLTCTDPSTSRAIDGSLWELTTLARHYWAPVQRLAGLFSDRLTKPPFDLDQILLKGCYAGQPEYGAMVVRGEMEHRWSKKLPPTRHELPTLVFQ